MRGIRAIVAVVLIALGVLALVYGGFSYTKESHGAELGPVKLELKEKKRVNVPIWAGVAAIAVGTGVLLFGGRRD